MISYIILALGLWGLTGFIYAAANVDIFFGRKSSNIRIGFYLFFSGPAVWVWLAALYLFEKIERGI